ncbi:leucine rich repeat (LRR) protein [Roseimicrobium gellanilyticum]|uniref:Leucine rich repeat (LRR) protein n=1 Tax=Roseimicrobium gellanilyticum TaxID=748857 RepID=A0A366H7Z0_9BACT|nr:G protein-coupled receptor LGR4 [Roseimicrobium gellanilyticum]RBP37622.1 leucine rich repeat (LRR) protein [Roseimicrobium gellanilyticum]
MKSPAALFCALTTLACSTTAFALDPHVEAVIRTVEGAKGKVEKTEDGQSLKLVDLAVPNTGPHDHRKDDPYDAAFFEHLGHITTLESLNVISTKFNDEWMPHIAKLTKLKTLRFTNNGKLTDAGMVQLAGLKDLESFSFVGTAITGKAYAKFEGFTKLTRVSHRGSKIDDEGLKELCDHLPNLESISLAHAKFTDAGAPNLAKLVKLKSLELGALATPAALRNITALPLENLQLGEGFDKSESLPIIKEIKSLKRLTLTNCKTTTEDDLKLLATMTQLESLEFGHLEMTDALLSQLTAFTFLKELKFYYPKRYSPETQARIQAAVPKVAVKFTPQ